ncbi:hypothetical protein AVEN_129867-1 [Araneus ventricosus]|uniref:Uncharacterized protein n=1 Tax=Araneus ventricosus TaxID=182803 RepID=A0A4Y2VAF5_ARAVE|nr:hypothetical protein AVEN_129867-1 [Araneus ventricosus]
MGSAGANLFYPSICYISMTAKIPAGILSHVSNNLERLNCFTQLMVGVPYGTQRLQGNCYIEKSRDPLGTSEYFGVVWNSISDSLLSLYEILKGFEEACALQETKRLATDVCNFYSEAIAGLQSYVVPWSLKHYCKTAIRKELFETQNGFLMPSKK